MVSVSANTVAFLANILAIYFCYKLWGETRGERYWFFFLLAAILLSTHSALEVMHAAMPDTFHDLMEPLTELVEMGGGLSLAYASYGLVTSMRNIRSEISAAHEENDD